MPPREASGFGPLTCHSTPPSGAPGRRSLHSCLSATSNTVGSGLLRSNFATVTTQPPPSAPDAGDHWRDRNLLWDLDIECHEPVSLFWCRVRGTVDASEAAASRTQALHRDRTGFP